MHCDAVFTRHTEYKAIGTPYTDMMQLYFTDTSIFISIKYLPLQAVPHESFLPYPWKKCKLWNGKKPKGL
jgi:hypothetical protein